MRTIFCVLSLFFCITIFGQDVTIQVQNGITNLEKDPQFKHAILSMYVVDSKTGKVVFEKNMQSVFSGLFRILEHHRVKSLFWEETPYSK